MSSGSRMGFAYPWRASAIMARPTATVVVIWRGAMRASRGRIGPNRSGEGGYTPSSAVGPVDRRQRHVDQPQVHGELPAVVDQVIQQDPPQDGSALALEEDLAVRLQDGELFLHLGVRLAGDGGAGRRDVLVEPLQVLGGGPHGGRLLAADLPLQRFEAQAPAGQFRHVRRDLAEGARLRVRLPVQPVGRDALEQPSGRRHLRVELGQKGFTALHGGYYAAGRAGGSAFFL